MKRKVSMLCRLSAVLSVAATMLCAQAQPGAGMPALNSYGQPPFVPVGTERHSGLAGELVAQLNEALGQSPHLQLENLPRRRLELTLVNREFNGLALFLAPEFLVASAQRGAAWSAPVMVDENRLVSMRPLKPAVVGDLQGLRLGGIAGHVYRVLDPFVEAGRIEREDAVDHIANLKKLCLGRVDFVVISKSELAGTEPHARCAQPYLSQPFPEPQLIVRRVLVRMPDEDRTQDLLMAIATVACSDRWAALLARYGLATVGCRHRDSARVADLGLTSPGRQRGDRSIRAD